MPPQVYQALLFVDIVGSRDLQLALDAMGDRATETYLGSVDEPVRAIWEDCTRQHGGTARSDGGDGLFITFAHARDAVAFARRCQDAVLALPPVTLPQGGTRRIEVAIGIDVGSVVDRPGVGGPNVSGPTIARARRVESLAAAGQVLLSGDAARNLGPLDGVALHAWGPQRFKEGDTCEIVEVVWDGRAPRAPGGRAPPSARFSRGFAHAYRGVLQAVTDDLLAQPASAARIRRFHAGQEVDWDVLAAGADVPRPSVAQEARRILATAPDGLRLLLLVGPPGVGKSTAAWRIAADAHRELGLPVARALHGKGDEALLRLADAVTDASGAPLILIDELQRVVGVKDALRNLDPRTPLTLLATWPESEPIPRTFKGELVPIRVPPPGPDDVEALLQKQGKTLQALPRAAQQRLAQAHDFVELGVEATEGEEVAAFVQRTLERMKSAEPALHAAALAVAVSWHVGVAVPVSVLSRLAPDDAEGWVDRPEAEGWFRWFAPGRTLRGPHQVIARAAVKDARTGAVALRALLDATAGEDAEEAIFGALLARNLHASGSVIVPDEAHRAQFDRLGAAADDLVSLTLWASNLARAGNKPTADLLYARAAAKTPTSGGEVSFYAMLHRGERGDPRAAVPTLLAYARAHPKDELGWSILIPFVDEFGTAADRAGLVMSALARLREPLKSPSFVTECLRIVERRGDAAQLDDALDAVDAWLRANPWDGTARTAYLSVLARRAEHDPTGTRRAALATTLEQTRAWLEEHDADSTVRLKYLNVAATFSPRAVRDEAFRSAQAWLERHPDDTFVRTGFLALLERSAPDERARLLDATEAWLADHPGDSSVRVQFLAAVHRRGTPAQQRRAIAATRAWLASHPTDASTRARYLLLVQGRGSDAEVAAAVDDALAWLDAHPEDRHARASLLSLVESRGDAAQAERAIEQTRAWLASGREEHPVRALHLRLVERYGSADEMEAALDETLAHVKARDPGHALMTALLDLADALGRRPAAARVLAYVDAWPKLRTHTSVQARRAAVAARLG